MAVAGIVAEYNPFHAGHLYQLTELRRILGEDTPVVIALSGDFVQRGEAAIYSKFARAAAAVECGASLVVELPLPWCLASAEGFARGGVGLLAATGVVDTLVFGSECGEIGSLQNVAAAVDSPLMKEALRRFLDEGLPFAAARERAVAELFGEETAKILKTPNDILGVEYIKAQHRLSADMELLPIRRVGSGHDAAGSASDIRKRLAAGESIETLVPPAAASIYNVEETALRGAMRPEKLRLPILSRLRALEREELAALPDVGEGLENKLSEVLRTATSPEEAAALCKSKRYALSRLRRIILSAALGIEKGMADGIPPYIRVLAMDEKGRGLLRKIEGSASLPVIIKSASVRSLGDSRAEKVFILGAKAHDLYVLGYSDTAQQRGDGDWRQSPYVK